MALPSLPDDSETAGSVFDSLQLASIFRNIKVKKGEGQTSLAMLASRKRQDSPLPSPRKVKRFSQGRFRDDIAHLEASKRERVVSIALRCAVTPIPACRSAAFIFASLLNPSCGRGIGSQFPNMFENDYHSYLLLHTLLLLKGAEDFGPEKKCEKY